MGVRNKNIPVRKLLLLCLMAALLCGTALAAETTGDVASVVESTWKDAAAQIKTWWTMWCFRPWI